MCWESYILILDFKHIMLCQYLCKNGCLGNSKQLSVEHILVIGIYEDTFMQVRLL